MAFCIKHLNPALAIALSLAAAVFGIDAVLTGSNARLDILYVLIVLLFRRSPRPARRQEVVLPLVAGIFVALPLAILPIEIVRQPDQWFYRGVIVAALAYLAWLPKLPEPTTRSSDSAAKTVARPVQHAGQLPKHAIAGIARTPPAKRAARSVEKPKPGRERRVYPRFVVFAAVQVAPYSGTARLSYARFREFACRDLSQNGLAFLAREVLTWNVIVVALRSQGQKIYRVAEIVRCRPHLDDHGGTTYLYGCRFTDRPCPQVIDAPGSEFEFRHREA